MSEKVNHPAHYNAHPIECIEEMRILFGDEAVYHFCLCNAWKYRERAPYKGTPKEDNDKADWYLQYAKNLKQEIDCGGSKNML